MSGRVVDVDKGFKAFMLRMKKAAEGADGVKVGVFDAGPRPGGVTNVMLAAIHEFGVPSSGIPERSFLRSTVDANQAKYQRLEKTLAKQVTEGRLTRRQVLELLGQQAVADVKARITSQTGFAPLKEKTIARKGSSKALIDSGQLVGSITYQVGGAS